MLPITQWLLLVNPCLVWVLGPSYTRDNYPALTFLPQNPVPKPQERKPVPLRPPQGLFQSQSDRNTISELNLWQENK